MSSPADHEAEITRLKEANVIYQQQFDHERVAVNRLRAEVAALRAQLNEAVDWLKKVRTGMYAVSSLDGFLAGYAAARAKVEGLPR